MLILAKLPLAILVPILVLSIIGLFAYVRKAKNPGPKILWLSYIFIAIGGIGILIYLYAQQGHSYLILLGQVVMGAFITIGFFMSQVGVYLKVKSDPEKRKLVLRMWAIGGSVIIGCIAVIIWSLS